MTAVLIYAVFVFVLQLLQHTSAAFSLLFFGFVMLAGAAFNLAGGFSTVIGAYVCWYWLFTCGLGVTLKIVFAEPADSNLTSPLLDMAAYTASMAMLLFVVGVLKWVDLRKFALATSGFANFGAADYKTTAWGFWVIGSMTLIINTLFPPTPGTLVSALNYINIFYPIGVIFGTIAAVRNSGGRRAFNAVNVLCMVPTFIYGFLGYSKQGMMTPIVCWLVSITYCRLRLRVVHYILIGCIVAFVTFFVSTWSTGRITVSEEGDVSLANRLQLAIYNLQHFDELQAHVGEVAEIDREVGIEGYFNERHGIFNRLSIIEVDDQLFAFTAKGHYEGYSPITGNFLNWIPHFLAPNKQPPGGGNSYAHEMGTISEDDYSTGISFSPSADAFHIDGWIGVFLLLPAIWILLFESIDLVVGDMKYTPWGLFLVVFFAHAASESALGSPINFIFYGNLSLVVAILFTAKVAPVIGTAISGRVPNVSLGIS